MARSLSIPNPAGAWKKIWDIVVNLAQSQGRNWLWFVLQNERFVRDIDLTSKRSMRSAFEFAGFVYIVSVAIFAVQLFLTKDLDLIFGQTVLVGLAFDLGVTALFFFAAGPLLHFSSKIFRAKGSAWHAFLIGLYVMGIWPLAQLLDFVAIRKEAIKDASQLTSIGEYAFLAFFWILTVSLLVFWFRVIRRASRRVYKRSRRTSLTAGLAVSLIVLAYVVFVEHFHQQVLDVTREMPVAPVAGNEADED